MARFRGMVRGSRGAVTRLGGKALEVEANGWNYGIEVTLLAKDKNTTEIRVSRTGGSNGGQKEQPIYKETVSEAGETLSETP